MSASVGTTVPLNCELEKRSGSSITWYNNERQVVRWQGQSRPSLVVKPRNCGILKFRCIAKNRYGSATRNFAINVRGETYI